MVALPTLHFPRVTAIASAAALTVPKADCVVPISGTTTITSITAGGTGQVVILEFASAGLKVTNGSNLKLRGDFLSCAALDTLTLECDGTNWIEVCRAMTPPHCELILGNTQLITASTVTAILFDSETVDNAAMHDLVTNKTRITFPINGVWIYGAMLQWPSGIASGARFITQLRDNVGTAVSQQEASQPNAGTFLAQNPSKMSTQNAGTYMEVIAYQDSVANQTLAASVTKFWAAWIGPA